LRLSILSDVKRVDPNRLSDILKVDGAEIAGGEVKPSLDLIRRVFDRARVILRHEHGIAMPENPARWDDLKAMGFETPKELTKGNHPSLGYGEMPDFIAALRARKVTAALAVDGMCR
jgi:hypothetical protein